MNNDRIDPSAIDEYLCPRCYQTFLALFLFLKHAREQHGERLAPLSPSAAGPGYAAQEGTAA